MPKQEQAVCAKNRRRSLEMRRSLAIGFAVAGLILAAVYLFSYWWENSAECPVPGVIRNALALFLGFVFLGLAAALIVQRVGRKVHIAGDAPGGRPMTAEPAGSNDEPAAPAAAAGTIEESQRVALAAAPERTKVSAAPAPTAQPEPIAAPPTLKPAWQFEPNVPAAPVLPSSRLQPQSVATPPTSPVARPEPAAVPAPNSLRWLTEAPGYETALEQPGRARALHALVGSWEAELAGERKEAAAAAEEAARATPSRLSALRGLTFALGSKEEKHSTPEAGETKTAPAPQPERAVAVGDLAPVSARGRTVAPQSSGAVPAHLFSPLPEVPILPSRRGQYKRND
jgi:hypothetical protein